MKHMNLNIKRVKPEQRLTNDTFDPRSEDDHQIGAGLFTCGKCGNEIQFTTRSFQKHFGLNASNFAHEIHEEFNRFRKVNLPFVESFLDFECPKCKMKIRFIYESYEFAMSCHFYRVTEILESF